MGISANPTLLQADREYMYERETIFRRELENILLGALSYALSISNGTDQEASLTSKAGQYNPSVGSVVVGA